MALKLLGQKAIPAADIEEYMKGKYKEVGGFVARAADTAHLKTYDEMTACSWSIRGVIFIRKWMNV